MLAYLGLMRPLNCLMSAVGVFIGGLIVAEVAQLTTADIYIAMLAAFLISGAGNAINDYYDLEADRVNRPKRPIVSGKISKNSALVFSVVLFAIGIGLTTALSTIYPLVIAVVNSALLVLYSALLQNKIYIGNIVISYLTGSTFLFGGAAMGNVVLPLILTLLAGIANFSREIVKDLEDIEGDKNVFKKKGKTGKLERFAVSKGGVRLRYNSKTSILMASVVLILDIIISPLPYLLGILGIVYLFFVILTDSVFLYCIFLMRKGLRSDFGRISRDIKIGMFLGLVAFIAGVLI